MTSYSALVRDSVLAARDLVRVVLTTHTAAIPPEAHDALTTASAALTTANDVLPSLETVKESQAETHVHGGVHYRVDCGSPGFEHGCDEWGGCCRCMGCRGDPE